MKLKGKWIWVIVVCCLTVPVMAAKCPFSGGGGGTPLLQLILEGRLSGLPGINAVAATFSASTSSTNFTTFTSTSFTYYDAVWGTIYYYGTVYEGSIYYPNYAASTTNCGDGFDGVGNFHLNNGVTGEIYYGNTVGVFLEDSDHELVLPSEPVMGIDVKRKIYANPDGRNANKDNFIRWLEIMTNNTASTKTVNIVVGGDLGSDSSTEVSASDDGDLLAEGGVDNWFVTRESGAGGDPVVAHLVDGSIGYDMNDYLLADNTTLTILYHSSHFTSTYQLSTNTMSASSEDIIYSWTGVTLDPGETKVLMHLELLVLENGYGDGLGTTDAVAGAKALESAPAKVVAGMDADEINAVFNWPAALNNCNVTGDAGSVAGSALVMVINQASGDTAESYAMADGSFGVCINAAAGNRIEVWENGSFKGTVIAQ